MERVLFSACGKREEEQDKSLLNQEGKSESKEGWKDAYKEIICNMDSYLPMMLICPQKLIKSEADRGM